MSDFIVSFLSPYLCGYRKGFNTQHVVCLELQKKRINGFNMDNKGFGGAIITDPSKIFDILHHDL